MAIQFGSTFSYRLLVPDDWADASGPWQLEPGWSSNERSARAGNPGLVGKKPRLGIEQLGVPDPSEREGIGPTLPSVKRARLNLTSRILDRGPARSASFIVASEFLDSARPGDELYLRRDSGAGLSIAIIRDEDLVVAAGALGSVPLGKRVRIFLPAAAIKEAEAAFRKVDPDYRFAERPLAIEIDSETRILREGRSDFESYAVFVVSFGGDMGPSEVLGISQTSLCSPVAGSASAQLLAIYGLSIPSE